MQGNDSLRTVRRLVTTKMGGQLIPTGKKDISVEASDEPLVHDGNCHLPPPPDMKVAKLAFGGGCHWCTEGVFQTLRGVAQVEQGFVQSDEPADTWAEGVIVTFDPFAIEVTTLSEVHLRTHSATRARPPRSKYRSAIYVFEDSQRHEAELAITRFADESGKAVHTLVLPFRNFSASDERYRNYYRTDPSRPFCRRFIDPKLEYIRRHFSEIALPEVRA